MSLVLRDVVEHPLVRGAQPVLVSGHGQLDHAVRWVHTADLYDIAPLLRGSEVLLTNGVGLLGVDEVARRVYVRRLAERGVAGLFFEIGRTFAEIPPDMIEEAVELDLPVVVLQPVLRFTEVAEAVNSELIDRSVTRLRYADLTSRGLSEVLARGGALTEIVEQVSDALGTWAELTDSTGRVVVSVGTRPASATSPHAQVPVLVDGTAWGRLAVGTEGTSDLLVDAVLERAPTVIGLSLIQRQPEMASAMRGRQLLLDQLVSGRPIETRALTDRLHAAGLQTRGHEFVCVAVNMERVPQAPTLLDQLIRSTGHGIFGLAGGALCALIVGQPDAASPQLGIKVRQVAQRIMHGQARAGATVGRTTRAVSDLPRSMAETRTSLDIATTLHVKRPVVPVQSLAVERLLHHLSRGHGNHDELRQFVADQLGPLIETDRRKEGKLLHTLETLVECGGAKTATAHRLHLRRQSLYYRLGQIATVLDVDLDDPRQLTTLSIALTARRMLAPGDTMT